jgi:hypothetical protein
LTIVTPAGTVQEPLEIKVAECRVFPDPEPPLIPATEVISAFSFAFTVPAVAVPPVSVVVPMVVAILDTLVKRSCSLWKILPVAESVTSPVAPTAEKALVR